MSLVHTTGFVLSVVVVVVVEVVVLVDVVAVVSLFVVVMVGYCCDCGFRQIGVLWWWWPLIVELPLQFEFNKKTQLHVTLPVSYGTGRPLRHQQCQNRCGHIHSNSEGTSYHMLLLLVRTLHVAFMTQCACLKDIIGYALK